MKEKMRYYFTFSGRISRRPYIINNLLLMLACYIVTFVISLISDTLAECAPEFSLFTIIHMLAQTTCILLIAGTVLLQFAAALSLGVRRLHDMNFSGRWMGPFVIVNIVAFFIRLAGVPQIIKNSSLAEVYIVSYFVLVAMNSCMTFMLALNPGQAEANKFGESPKPQLQNQENDTVQMAV